MKRSTFLAVILMLVTGYVFAQKSLILAPNGYNTSSSLNRNVIIEEMPLPPPNTLGTYYISDDWNNGNVLMMNDKELQGLGLKYDLENDLLELNTHQGVKVLNRSKVKKFTWRENNQVKERAFINSSELKFEKPAEKGGILEVLVEGKISLVSKISLTLIKAHYTPAFDAGNKDHKRVKEETYYLVKNDMLYNLGDYKKAEHTLFEDYSLKVQDYAKTNKLKFKKKDDLVKIVNYYNQLAKE